MNRTQRAIKKSYRESENTAKQMKNKMIRKRKLSNPNSFSLFDNKGEINESVKRYAKDEKTMRSCTHEFMSRARKNNKEAAIA